MNEKPILFNRGMVRAILEGRKTQTRRVVKGEALRWLEQFNPEFVADPDNSLSPYGYTGDQLWVRETWSTSGSFDGIKPSELMSDPAFSKDDIRYRAAVMRADPYYKWRPSIFMPRWASRISLTINNLRVERLNQITNDDAIAEGLHDVELISVTDPNDTRKLIMEPCSGFALQEFEQLWESINGKRGYGWETNPWVWVIEFELTKSERLFDPCVSCERYVKTDQLGLCSNCKSNVLARADHEHEAPF